MDGQRSAPVMENPLQRQDEPKARGDAWKDARIAELQKDLEVEKVRTQELRNEINTLCTEIQHLKEQCEQKAKNPVNGLGTPGQMTDRRGEPFQNQAGALSKPFKSNPMQLSKKTGISGEAFDPETVMKYKLKYVAKDQAVITKLETAIQNNPMLGKLDIRQIRDIVNCMEARTVNVGEEVIEEGQEGQELFISECGTYEVSTGGKQLAVFGSWYLFGELALLYGCQRTATVTVLKGKSDSEVARVWVIDRHLFQVIMLRTGILRQQQNLRFIRDIPFFDHLKAKEEELLRLVDALHEEYYSPGQYVFRQGAIGETFYIIQEGELEVIREPSTTQGKAEVVKTLGPGETFGERALQSDDIRTASIKATTDAVLFVIGRRAFMRTLGLSQGVNPDNLPSVPPKRIYDAEPDVLAPIGSSATSPHAVSSAKLKASDFNVLGRLGAGGFGRVDLVQRPGEKETFALKCLSKKHIVQRKQQAHVFAERDIQRTINHPFIARLYATFRDPCYLYMLMEPCLGGEMWCVLRQCGRLTEKEARFVIACVVEAIAYLHRHHIIYRDLKPENLMLASNGYCKLVDFGFAKTLLPPAHKTWTFCGTPEYMAPEIILNKGHSFSADLWALGILIFELLSGWPPFSSNNEIMETYTKVLSGFEKCLRFPADNFPSTAKSLILALCKSRPSDRLGVGRGENGIAAIRSHQWFASFSWIGLREQTLEPPIYPQLKGPTDLTNFDQSDAKKDTHKAAVDTSGWDEGF